jgi:hypothetical protein
MIFPVFELFNNFIETIFWENHEKTKTSKEEDQDSFAKTATQSQRIKKNIQPQKVKGRRRGAAVILLYSHCRLLKHFMCFVTEFPLFQLAAYCVRKI